MSFANPFRLCLAIAFSLAAGGAAVSEETRDEVAKQQWIDCMGGSFSAQLPRMNDRYLAAETALQACKTEKRAWVRIMVSELGVMPVEAVTNAADEIEAKVKALLISGITKRR